MKNYIFALFLFISTGFLYSCTKVRCPGYDFNHPVTQWHWFPDLKKSYTFINKDSSEITFIQAKIQYSTPKTISCPYCYCSVSLESYYDCTQFSMSLRSLVGFGISENGTNITDTLGSGFFGVDRLGDCYTVTQKPEVFEQCNCCHPSFQISALDSVQIVGKAFMNTVLFEPLDSNRTKVKKIWIKKGSGVIGFQRQGVIWRKK